MDILLSSEKPCKNIRYFLLIVDIPSGLLDSFVIAFTKRDSTDFCGLRVDFVITKPSSSHAHHTHISFFIRTAGHAGYPQEEQRPVS